MAIDSAGPTSHIYVSQRLRLHYVDWGNPDAPPLLMVHGARDHCRNWDWIARELKDDWHIIAPDLRGHGDSAWADDGQYWMAAYVYDIAQLIHQLKLAPVSILAHSMGAGLSARYAGLYPENVDRLLLIEGLNQLPNLKGILPPEQIVPRMTNWIQDQRQMAGRQPKRYASIAEAVERMLAENKHLTPAQGRHLTRHGVSQNEDGSYSWKFDNYNRVFPPNDITLDEMRYLWSRVACPTMVCCGEDSFSPIPEHDNGRLRYFQNARLEIFDRAGHWLHHDRTDKFIPLARDFLQHGNPA